MKKVFLFFVVYLFAVVANAASYSVTIKDSQLNWSKNELGQMEARITLSSITSLLKKGDKITITYSGGDQNNSPYTVAIVDQSEDADWWLELSDWSESIELGTTGGGSTTVILTESAKASGYIIAFFVYDIVTYKNPYELEYKGITDAADYAYQGLFPVSYSGSTLTTSQTVTVSMKFTPSEDINALCWALIDGSSAANYWLNLSSKDEIFFVVEEYLMAGKTYTLNFTYPIEVAAKSTVKLETVLYAQCPTKGAKGKVVLDMDNFTTTISNLFENPYELLYEGITDASDYAYQGIFPVSYSGSTLTTSQTVKVSMRFTPNEDINALCWALIDGSSAANYWLNLTSKNKIFYVIEENLVAGRTYTLNFECPIEVAAKSTSKLETVLYAQCPVKNSEGKVILDVDNFTTSILGTSSGGYSTSVKTISSENQIAVNGGSIYVNGEAPVFVVTVSGKKTANANLKAGVYFVVVDGETVGISVR